MILKTRQNKIADMCFIRNLEYVGGDYRDFEEVFKSFIKILRKNGLHVYKDPVCKDSGDQYGWFVSKNKLTRKQLTILKNRYEPI